MGLPPAHTRREHPSSGQEINLVDRYMLGCFETINLPNQPSIVVPAAIMRWVRGQMYGVETLVVEMQTHRRLEHVIKRLEQESVESIP